MMRIETVAVLGTGEAAHACAMLAALSGCAVRVHDPALALLDAAFEAVRFRVELAIERGLLTRTDRQRILDGILFTPDLDEAVTGADLIAELDGEVAEGAHRLAGAADRVRATAALAAADAGAALALAGAVAQPGRVLVLVVDRSGGFSRLSVDAGPSTSPHTLAGTRDFASRLNARGRHEG